MGQEEYRNRMTRLGMPAYDVQEMLTDNTVAGFDSVAMAVGRNVLNEYLLTNTLPKDVADMHMRGDIHIGDTAGWSLVPDTLFARLPDMLDGSVPWDSQTPRIRPEGGSAPAALAAALERVSWEASGEVVVDGLVDAAQGMSGDGLADALAFIHHCGADVALRIPLESEAAAGMLGAYRDYTMTVETPRVRVVAEEPLPAALATTIAPVAARVARTGFAKRTTGPQRLPHYDYEDRAPYWDAKLQRGFYTTLGDALELARERDGALAIIGSGEEVHLEFPAQNDPPPGHRRHFAIRFEGWAKDMDLYTEHGDTVGPLPAPAEADSAMLARRDALHARYNVRAGGF
jgi:hypothetical protein